MALLQPLVCACVCPFVCLFVVKLCMHSGLGNQVSHPPGLHLVCAHNNDDAQLSDVLLVAVSREQLPREIMVKMLKILKLYGICPDSWRQIAWHTRLLF